MGERDQGSSPTSNWPRTSTTPVTTLAACTTSQTARTISSESTSLVTVPIGLVVVPLHRFKRCVALSALQRVGRACEAAERLTEDSLRYRHGSAASARADTVPFSSSTSRPRHPLHPSPTMRATVQLLSKASRAPLTSKQGNKNYYKGEFATSASLGSQARQLRAPDVRRDLLLTHCLRLQVPVRTLVSARSEQDDSQPERRRTS